MLQEGSLDVLAAAARSGSVSPWPVCMRRFVRWLCCGAAPSLIRRFRFRRGCRVRRRSHGSVRRIGDVSAFSTRAVREYKHRNCSGGIRRVQRWIAPASDNAPGCRTRCLGVAADRRARYKGDRNVACPYDRRGVTRPASGAAATAKVVFSECNQGELGIHLRAFGMRRFGRERIPALLAGDVFDRRAGSPTAVDGDLGTVVYEASSESR